MRVQLHILDAANRLTLRMILEADGHSVVESTPDVVITDEPENAASCAQQTPTLVLAGLSDVPAAVRAMRRGAFGYILVPFQIGEAECMVRRAAASRMSGKAQTTASGAAMQPPAPLAEVEARHIQETLRYCRNNRAQAARLLGIGRNTLWRKIRQLEKSRRLE